MKISAVILTHNNERTIANCILSIKHIVDEIIIVDDFSSDETLNIVSACKKVRLFQRELSNDFASQRNFGIGHAANDWILHIDSDEYFSVGLQNEIAGLCLDKDINYLVKRKNMNFHGYTIEELNNRPLLATKEKQFISELHEYIVSERSQFLKSFLVHDCWIDLEDFVEDINTYSYRKALTWHENGRKYRPHWLIFRQLIVAIYLFFVRYFLQGRFKFGPKAFLYCLYWSSEEILVGLKYIELEKAQCPESEY